MKCNICGERVEKGDASDCSYVEHLLVHLLERLIALENFARMHL
jgi:hypothetical protein